jgi:TetR/AcrR family transcriptional regulator, tetracycline repressor protein
MKKPPTRSLRSEQIVGLALEIADREGLAAVSFRRLADELGVTAMALYHHVKDKAALLGQMTDRLLAEVEVPPDGGDWRAALRTLLRSFVSVREQHPCTADLLQSQFSGSSQAPRLTQVALQILERAGFDPATALPIVQQLGTLLVVRTRPPTPPATGSPAARQRPPHPSSSAEAQKDPPFHSLGRRSRLGASAVPPSPGKTAWSWSHPRQDLELGVELLIHGVEGLLTKRARRRRT